MSTTYIHEVSESSAPSVEPLTLADAKSFMKISSSTDNDLITAQIVVARKIVEQYLNRALITQTLIAYFNRYQGRVYLPNAPVQSISEVKRISADNTETTLAADTDYYLKAVQDKYIEMAGAYYIPEGHSLRDMHNDYALKVTYVAGYGNASTDVPNPILEAIKRLVLHLYDNRDTVIIGAAVDNMPMGIKALLEPYINVSL